MKIAPSKVLPYALIVLNLILAGCGEELDQQRIQQLTAGGDNCSAQAPLTTSFGGVPAGPSGNMFSIVAKGLNIRIDSFDAHDSAAAGTPSPWEIYFKNGTYIGFETIPGAWTLAGGSPGVLSAGQGFPTPLPIAVGVTVPAGQVYSFYVTKTNASGIMYSVTSSEGAVFAGNANLDFLEGKSLTYPFAGTFSPRTFNGNIHYSTCP